MASKRVPAKNPIGSCRAPVRLISGIQLLLFLALQTIAGGNVSAQSHPIPNICSGAGQQLVAANIYNNSPSPIDVIWMDYECRERKYFTIEPGWSRSLNSYENGAWRFRDASSGKIVKQVVLRRGPAVANVVMREDCAAASSTRSELVFNNLTGTIVDVYWKGYDCTLRKYASLPPAGTHRQLSYAGHGWQFRTGNGAILRDLLPSADGSMQVGIGERHTRRDMQDDLAFQQIHVVYMLPSDAHDERLDTLGSIATTVAAADKWLARSSNGRRLVLDRFDGALDITHLAIGKTSRQMLDEARRSFGDEVYLREVIQQELRAAGMNAPGKLYVVFYAGAARTCGAAYIPYPGHQHNTVALYLKGRAEHPAPCAGNPFAQNEDSPGYWGFSFLHEIFHALGAYHVADSPADLMYAGAQDWYPGILDLHNNDYFDHADAGKMDVARSAYLTPSFGDAVALPPRTARSGIMSAARQSHVCHVD